MLADKQRPGRNNPRKPRTPRQRAIHRYLLGDETYQAQLAALQQGRQDFRIANRADKENIREDFGDARHRMRGQRKDDLQAMLADYASRGIADSGVFLNDRSEYQKDFTNQLTDLHKDKARNLFSLKSSATQTGNQFSASVQAARLEALRRRAAQFGLTG